LAEPEKDASKESQPFAAARALVRTVARLPRSGRLAFRDIVADECGDVSVLRDVLLPGARALAGAAVRFCVKHSKLDPLLWESVFLLQLLWVADKQRLDDAAAAAQAARAARTAEPARRPSLTRADSSIKMRIGNTELTGSLASTLATSTAPAASATLPQACFEIDALVGASFPAELELALFMQQARMQVVKPELLVTDTRFEVDSHGMLPAHFHSFMANGNLVPVAYKQQVLQVENMARQQQEQMTQMFSQPGGLAQILSWGAMQMPANSLFFVLHIRREHLLADTSMALEDANPQDLRRPLKVKFAGEDGVDEGGVTREYFRLLLEKLFTPEYGAFRCDADSRFLWFDTGSKNDPQDFWMIGAVLGLAVYNNLPGINVSFPPALFKKLTGVAVTLDDLKRLFPSQGASIQAVLDWTPPPGASGEEADKAFQDTFCLDFSTSYEAGGQTKTVNLLDEEGEDAVAPVTFQRRDEFAELFKDWYLASGATGPNKKQYEAFKRGFSRVCGSPVFNCLSAAELEAIVSGEKDLDFNHLRKGAQVVDGTPYKPGYLEGFWKILLDLDPYQRKQFLNFVTGSDLAPVGGLERLGMKIQWAGGEPIQRLPTSHTCFHLLMLPEYSDFAKLKRLLLSAIENAEGFGLE